MSPRLGRLARVCALVLTLIGLPLVAAQAQKPGSGTGGTSPAPSPQAITGLDITPDGQSATVTGGVPTTAVFFAHNGLTTSASYTFSCSGAKITCGSVVPSSATIPAGGGGEIEVTYTPAALNTGGSVVLTATPSGETGSYTLTIRTPGAPRVALRNQNGDNIDRGLCLTTSAGESAGNSCGDLFVVHSMPAYRSLGRDRAPTLLYNSAAARGLTLIAASVTEAANTAVPSRLIGILTVGTSKDSADFSPPAPGTTGQLVLGKGLQPLPTGIYPFQFVFRNYYSATSIKDTTLNGRILVLNRAGSEYGQGWGLVGVDQIVLNPADTTQRLLVGGDGSLRLYHRGNALTSGLLTQLNLGAFSATSAVDGDTTTAGWNTNTATANNAWVRADFATAPQAVTTAGLYTASGTSTATYDVEFSDDAASWSVAFAGFKPQAGVWSRVIWLSTGFHRYWRLLLKNTPGTGPVIRELSFGSVNVFYGAPGDAPDSLERLASTLDTTQRQGWYRHTLKHGVRVTFDQTGRQRFVRNRAGALTDFIWRTLTGGAVRLDSIIVPPNDGTKRAYRFIWNTTTTRLDKMIDPGGRSLTATMTADSLLQRLRNSGGETVRFAYANGQMTQRVVTRKGLPGDSAITKYAYANGARLTSVAIPIDTAAVYGTTAFSPWDEKGLATSPLNATVAVTDPLGLPTRVDGPLGSTGDAADIWVDGFGGPTRITQLGLAATTTLLRDSTKTLPAVVTRVEFPNHRWGLMAYNARGNLSTVRDSTWQVDGLLSKATVYSYQSASAPDSPTSITDTTATGAARTHQYTYSTPAGLLLTATDPHPHQTAYAYGTSPNNLGLVTSITENQVETWVDSSTATTDFAFQTQAQVQVFGFDANGNLQSITSPTGVLSSVTSDGLGRVTETRNPLGFRKRWVYDSLNRVVTAIQYTAKLSPANALATCRNSQVLCALADDFTKAFTPAIGDSVYTQFWHEPAGVDSVSSPQGAWRSYRYTGSGQLYRELMESGAWRRTFYNAAGQDTLSLARYNGPNTGATFWDDTVHTQYDAVGRRVAISYPWHKHNYPITQIPFTATDSTPGDKISYQYDIVGNLIADSNRVAKIFRTYYGDGSLRSQVTVAAFSDSADYQYDRAGRRTRLSRTVLPSGPTDVMTYTYAANTDDLQSLAAQWGAPANITRTIAFTWDALGRRFQVVLPNGTANGIVVKYRYDAGGLLRRVVSTNPSAPSGLTDRFDFTYKVDSVDASGRILSTLTQCPGHATNDNEMTGTACAPRPSSFRLSTRYNRFGMMVSQKDGLSPSPEVFQYDTAGNMIMRKNGSDLAHFFKIGRANQLASDSLEGVNAGSVIRFLYDSLGSRKFSYIGTLPSNAVTQTVFYNDGLGRPSGIRDFVHNGGNPQNCYQYDPDGNAAVPCNNGFNVVYYDGHNVSALGYPRWMVANGPDTDDPLISLWRDPVVGTNSAEWYYVTDGAGRQFAAGRGDGAIRSGELNQYKLNGGAYAGGTAKSTTFGADRFSTPQAPGYSFFRNRLYDQATGRWTQEDPLGVAGGLNLYQFNGNNPVMFTDPFGLCGRERGNCLQGEDSYKPDPRSKFQSVSGPTGTGGVGVALPAALAPAGNLVKSATPELAGEVYAGPVTVGFDGDNVTLSASPAVGTLGVGVAATFGESPSGTFGGSVGGLFGQGLLGGVSLNKTGSGGVLGVNSFTVRGGVGYNIPGGLGNLFGRIARFFEGSVTQTYGQ